MGSGRGSGNQINGALHHQLEKFRAKFGREPGTEDPIFFDPDADDPTPLPTGSISRELDRLVANADEIGVPPALIKAFCDLGYLVTEENQHLFSAAEIEGWRETVERYRTEDEPDEGDLGEASRLSFSARRPVQWSPALSEDHEA